MYKLSTISDFKTSKDKLTNIFWHACCIMLRNISIIKTKSSNTKHGTFIRKDPVSRPMQKNTLPYG